MGNENKKTKTEDMRYGVLPLGEFTVESTNTKVVVAKGSVVDFTGNAIVNAANTGCLFGGGVDGAICRAGGSDLDKARRALPEVRRGVRCETGDAKITIGGDLNADYCIHAVGPQYFLARRGFTEQELDTTLYSAYVESIKRAQEKNVETLGFCLLSAGVFRATRPLDVVLQIGLMALLENTYEGLKEVYLIGFTYREVGVLRQLMAQYVESQTYPHELQILKEKMEDIKKRITEDDKNSGWGASSSSDEENLKFSEGDKCRLVNTVQMNGTVGTIVGYNKMKSKFRFQCKIKDEEKVYLIGEKNLELVPEPKAEEEVEAMKEEEGPAEAAPANPPAEATAPTTSEPTESAPAATTESSAADQPSEKMDTEDKASDPKKAE